MLQSPELLLQEMGGRQLRTAIVSLLILCCTSTVTYSVSFWVDPKTWPTTSVPTCSKSTAVHSEIFRIMPYVLDLHTVYLVGSLGTQIHLLQVQIHFPSLPTSPACWPSLFFPQPSCIAAQALHADLSWPSRSIVPDFASHFLLHCPRQCPLILFGFSGTCLLSLPSGPGLENQPPSGRRRGVGNGVGCWRED